MRSQFPRHFLNSTTFYIQADYTCCIYAGLLYQRTEGIAMPREQAPTPKVIQVPRRTLLVLCGPAASAKSTFPAQRFIATNIVSSDLSRSMIGDAENTQQMNCVNFDLD